MLRFLNTGREKSWGLLRLIGGSKAATANTENFAHDANLSACSVSPCVCVCVSAIHEQLLGSIQEGRHLFSV